MNEHYLSSPLEQKINELNSSILELDSLCTAQLLLVKKLINSSSESDYAAFKKELTHREENINTKEQELHNLTMKVLLTHAPMGYPFRLISSAIYMGLDYERMGDESEHIFDSVLFLLSGNYLSNRMKTDLLEVLHLCLEAQVNFINAMKNSDTESAQSVIENDKLINDLVNNAVEHAITNPDEMTDRITQTKVALEFYQALRSLERYGDHIKNNAQAILYVITNDSVISHRPKT